MSNLKRNAIDFRRQKEIPHSESFTFSKDPPSHLVQFSRKNKDNKMKER